MKRSIVGIISGLVLTMLAFAPMPTHASNATFFGPIVPAECHCDSQTIQGGGGTVNSAPDYGCVLQVVENVINFGVTLSTIIFTIYLVITGLSFITSAGSSEARSRAKTRFMNVFVGLLVLLCAWLIVDFVMKTIYNQGKFGPWNGILAGDSAGTDRCIVPNKPKAITIGSVVSGITTVAPGTTPGGAPTGATGGSTSLNIGKAVSNLESNAKTTAQSGCWTAVRTAICNGGLSAFCSPGPNYAKDAGSKLVANGYQSIYSGTYSYPSSDRALTWQAGDVAIFQAPCSNSGAGHSAMYTGTQWISDFRQSEMGPNKTGSCSFTVYRP